MTATLFQAHTRGLGDHDWLQSRHTFSFGSYQNPDRTGFGFLRVFNDDVVAAAKGFDTHPHRNMEIISIPLTGTLAHKDSLGHERTLEPDEVQVMSAGSGLTHSEYNGSSTDPVNFLQLWIYPKLKDITPTYDQKRFDLQGRQNRWQWLATPKGQQGSLSLNQDAWLSWVDLDAGDEIKAVIHDQNHGWFVFVIHGKIRVGNHVLKNRDAIGIDGMLEAQIRADIPSRVLCVEVPMQ